MSTLLHKLVKASSMLHEAIGDCQPSECMLDGRSSQHARNLLHRVTDFWKKATEKGALQNENECEKTVAAHVLGTKEGKSFMTTVNSFISGKSMSSVHKIIEYRVNDLENAVKQLQKKVEEHDKRLDKLEESVRELNSQKAAASTTRVRTQSQEAGQEEPLKRYQQVRIKEQPLYLKYMSGQVVELQVRYLEWDIKQLTEEACKHCNEDVRLVYAGKMISDKKYADVKLADMNMAKHSNVFVLSAARNAKESKATVEEAKEHAEETEQAEETKVAEEAEEEAKDEAEDEAEEVHEHFPSSTKMEAGASSSSCMWTCNVCTYAENKELFLFCEMCTTVKGTAQVANEDTCDEETSCFTIAQQEAVLLKRKHSDIMVEDEKVARELQDAWARRKSDRSKKA